MSVIVRQPAITDAVGAGMASALIERQKFGGRVPEEYWQTHTEATEIDNWHDMFAQLVQGRSISLALTHRQVVGMCVVDLAQRTRIFDVPRARDKEITYLGMNEAHLDRSVLTRLLDFVLPSTAPCQCWVWREDQVTRRFLRMAGFTLDGVSCVHPEQGLEYSRLVR